MDTTLQTIMSNAAVAGATAAGAAVIAAGLIWMYRYSKGVASQKKKSPRAAAESATKQMNKDLDNLSRKARQVKATYKAAKSGVKQVSRTVKAEAGKVKRAAKSSGKAVKASAKK